MKKSRKGLFSNAHFRNGSYSVGITVVVIAIVVLVNLIVSQLPSNIRQWDISSTKLYTLGDTTVEMLKGLDKEVTIYTVAEQGKTDARIEKLLNNYKAASDKIKLESIDPVLHPAALAAYDTTAGSLVVSCKETDKKVSISYDEIIKYDEMSYYYYGQYTETEFDGEGRLTSAIDSVVSDVTKNIYTTQGHGESGLSEQITDLIDKANMNVSSVNLLTEGTVPKECDLLILNAPADDLADDEKTMITDYMAGGGNVMILLGDTDSAPNLSALLKEYGMVVAKGYIADLDRCYQGNYYNIFPEVNTANEISEGLDTADNLALVSNARGMLVGEPARDTITVDKLMSTSENSYAMTEDSQEQNTYVLGASAVEETEDGKSRLVVISAGSLIDQGITASFTNLLNLDLFMNAVTWNFDDVTNISIPAKSLNVTYNTVTTAGFWSKLYTMVIPAVFLAAGFTVWMRRRKA